MKRDRKIIKQVLYCSSETLEGLARKVNAAMRKTDAYTAGRLQREYNVDGGHVWVQAVEFEQVARRKRRRRRRKAVKKAA
jgi:hypothetical protein